jgi:hypothetical protein
VSPGISNITEQLLQHANKNLHAAELFWASKGQGGMELMSHNACHLVDGEILKDFYLALSTSFPE